MRLITANLRAGRVPGQDLLLLSHPRRYWAQQRAAWQETARLWAAQDPDLICLQEVDFYQPRSGFCDLVGYFRNRLTDLTGTPWQSRFLAFYAGQTALGLRLPVRLPRSENSPLWRPFLGCDPWLGGFGVALLTRHPIRRWLSAKLGACPPRLTGQLSKPQTWGFYPGQTRNLLAAEVCLPRGPVLVGSAHLELHTQLAKYQLRRAWRGLQAARTTGLEPAGSPCLLAGDFNLSAPTTRQLLADTKVLASPSFPAEKPRASLDQIVGEKNLVSRGLSTLHMPISDHRALSAELDWQ